MFGRKLNNMNDELYFVIRVWNFPHNDGDVGEQLSSVLCRFPLYYTKTMQIKV